MADTKVTALSEISVPALEDLLYLVDDPSGTPVSQKVTLARVLGVVGRAHCQGRLTTESGVPVSTSDRVAQSTLYFTPYQGNLVGLYDGTRWKLYSFTERSLALSGLTSGKNYDVFLWDNAGTLALELSAAWTNDTTRADALSLQDGIYCKNGALTRRYLGTIRTTGTTTIEDSLTKRFVWSATSRVSRPMRAIEGTDSWTYSTDSWRQANGNAANKVEYVAGLALDAVAALVIANNSGDGALVRRSTSVGVDSFTVAAGLFSSAIGLITLTNQAHYAGIPGLGYHYLAWLERGNGNTTATWYGDFGGTHMQSGIQGTVLG